MDTSYLALLLANEAKDSNDEYRGRHMDTKDAMDTKYQGDRGLEGSNKRDTTRGRSQLYSVSKTTKYFWLDSRK